MKLTANSEPVTYIHHSTKPISHRSPYTILDTAYTQSRHNLYQFRLGRTVRWFF